MTHPILNVATRAPSSGRARRRTGYCAGERPSGMIAIAVILQRPEANLSQVMHWFNGASWESLLQRFGDPVKWLVLRVARRYTGMMLAELGEVAGGMDNAAVGVALRRLERALPTDLGLQQLEARMVEMLEVKT